MEHQSVVARPHPLRGNRVTFLLPEQPMPKARDSATGSTISRTRTTAFDTRIGSAMSGRASKGIARRLRHHCLDLVAEPESFLVDADNHLLDGEAARATAWASTVAVALAATRWHASATPATDVHRQVAPHDGHRLRTATATG